MQRIPLLPDAECCTRGPDLHALKLIARCGQIESGTESGLAMRHLFKYSIQQPNNYELITIKNPGRWVWSYAVQECHADISRENLLLCRSLYRSRNQPSIPLPLYFFCRAVLREGSSQSGNSKVSADDAEDLFLDEVLKFGFSVCGLGPKSGISSSHFLTFSSRSIRMISTSSANSESEHADPTRASNVGVPSIWFVFSALFTQY